MTEQERALIGVASHLDALGIPYMIIGGIAVAFWGEPRATLDIDVTVWIAEDEMAERVRQITSTFPSRVADPERFARTNRVLPVRSAEAAVPIDIICGLLPFEENAIARAVTRMVSGTAVRVAAAEDLILHKIISDRAQDLADARAIIHRHAAALDRSYLDPRVAELADALERPDVADRYRQWLAESAAE